MDFTGLAAITGGLSSALDIGKAAVAARDAAKLSDAVLEMRDKIMDAQQRVMLLGAEAMALRDELGRAKDEALKLKAALQDRGSYELATVFNGATAYKPKVEPGKDGGDAAQPTHYVCQRCFDVGIKVVLQPRFEEGQSVGLRCTGCNTTLANEAGVNFTGRMRETASGRSVFPSL